MELERAGMTGEQGHGGSESTIDDTTLQSGMIISEGASVHPVDDISRLLLPTPQAPKPRIGTNPHIRPENIRD